MPETTKYFSSFRTQILSTENEDNMEFKKTTCGFTKNDVWFCTKRRVVFLRLSLPLSHRWEKTRTDAPTRRKNAVLFYPFCKTHLSKFEHKAQKTVYFTPKMGQKRGFFSFFFDFSPQHRKKTIE
jgi:hypothetical protein